MRGVWSFWLASKRATKRLGCKRLAVLVAFSAISLALGAPVSICGRFLVSFDGERNLLSGLFFDREVPGRQNRHEIRFEYRPFASFFLDL